MNKQKLLQLLETAHIPLWLVKDLCWLMAWRAAGIIMAIPTLLVAISIVYVTRKEEEKFLPNLSIAFWIIANANWMFSEFYDFGTRFYSIIPFFLGIIVFSVYLFKRIKKAYF